LKVRSFLLPFALLPALLPSLPGLAGCAAGSFESDVGKADGGPSPDGAAEGPTSGGPPGRYLTSATVVGTGSCQGVSLNDVLAAIRAANPELASVQTIYGPAGTTGDGSFVYPYARADGGFDVVFKQGQGDCAAGCTENDYVYFSTDAACAPVQVGHFHASWYVGGCLQITGTPMWNHPPPPDPLTVCGQDIVLGDLTGTYQLHAVGQRTPCTLASANGSVKAGSLDEMVELTIRQTAGDPTTGTVTFTGTGHALVDGVPLPAQFQLRRFDASLTSSDATCPSGRSVTARYDFAGDQTGGIEVIEKSNACSSCLGSMTLMLTP
jgi:hypothetical protein